MRVPRAPGHVLQALLDAEGWSAADLVMATGLPLVIVQGLLGGMLKFTVKTSEAMAEAFASCDPYTFIDLQVEWDAHLARS